MAETTTASASMPAAALTPQEKRAIMQGMIQAAVAKLPPLPDILEEHNDLYIPVRDGWKSRTVVG